MLQHLLFYQFRMEIKSEQIIKESYLNKFVTVRLSNMTRSWSWTSDMGTRHFTTLHRHHAPLLQRLARHRNRLRYRHHHHPSPIATANAIADAIASPSPFAEPFPRSFASRPRIGN